jgi:D-alanyl-D-alanine carboxypeptidase
VKPRLWQFARSFLLLAVLAVTLSAPGNLAAAPYAATVMDARTGEILFETNAETRLHPASLTKMLTLYIAFEAVERGEISLDTMVKVSKHAASEPPSKLGLKAGQRIQLRYLIRAAAVKSANDAATAIGEAISGSEEAFHPAHEPHRQGAWHDELDLQECARADREGTPFDGTRHERAGPPPVL